MRVFVMLKKLGYMIGISCLLTAISACSGDNKKPNADDFTGEEISFNSSNSQLVDLGSFSPEDTSGRIYVIRMVNDTGSVVEGPVETTGSPEFVILGSRNCESVKRMESCAVRVYFNPKNLSAGEYSLAITLGGVIQNISLQMMPPVAQETTVDNSIVFSSANLDFGSLNMADQNNHTRTVTIRNTSNEVKPLTMEFYESPGISIRNNCPDSLPPRSVCRVIISISLKDLESVGAVSSSVLIGGKTISFELQNNSVPVQYCNLQGMSTLGLNPQGVSSVAYQNDLCEVVSCQENYEISPDKKSCAQIIDIVASYPLANPEYLSYSGQSISANLVVSQGCEKGCTYSLESPLPSGLVFNATTGRFSGSITRASIYAEKRRTLNVKITSPNRELIVPITFFTPIQLTGSISLERTSINPIINDPILIRMTNPQNVVTLTVNPPLPAGMTISSMSGQRVIMGTPTGNTTLATNRVVTACGENPTNCISSRSAYTYFEGAVSSNDRTLISSYVNKYNAMYGISNLNFPVSFDTNETYTGFRPEGHVLGVCQISTAKRWSGLKQITYIKSRRIWVNPNYWSWATNTQKIALIWHELGHCHWLRQHEATYHSQYVSGPYFSPRFRKTIMAPSPNDVVNWIDRKFIEPVQGLAPLMYNENGVATTVENPNNYYVVNPGTRINSTMFYYFEELRYRPHFISVVPGMSYPGVFSIADSEDAPPEGSIISESSIDNGQVLIDAMLGHEDSSVIPYSAETEVEEITTYTYKTMGSPAYTESSNVLGDENGVSMKGFSLSEGSEEIHCNEAEITHSHSH